MLLKTLVAFIITAAFAGGAVYFGVQPQNVGNAVDNTKKTIVESPSKINSFLKKITKKTQQTNTARHKDVEVALKSDPTSTSNTMDEIYQNKEDILSTLLAQASQIETVELKDQAYLDIVNYATKFDLYRQADTAMKKIDQIELRDTARGQYCDFYGSKRQGRLRLLH